MNNDTGTSASAATAPEKGGKAVGILAVVLAAAVLAGYVAYVLASRFEVGYSPAALLLLQVLYVVSIAVGIAALCKRRFVCGLIGIAIPLLLPLCDLIVRLATR